MLVTCVFGSITVAPELSFMPCRGMTAPTCSFRISICSLQQLHILDTPLEERFERITRAARQMLKMPIAAISLIDTARQWFKSIQGLDVCETARDDAFCA